MVVLISANFQVENVIKIVWNSLSRLNFSRRVHFSHFQRSVRMLFHRTRVILRNALFLYWNFEFWVQNHTICGDENAFKSCNSSPEATKKMFWHVLSDISNVSDHSQCKKWQILMILPPFRENHYSKKKHDYIMFFLMSLEGCSNKSDQLFFLKRQFRLLPETSRAQKWCLHAIWK